MFKKNLALVLTIVMLVSSVMSAPVFADDTTSETQTSTETIPMQTIAYDNFVNDSDNYVSTGTTVTSCYAKDADGKYKIPGYGWSTNWVVASDDGYIETDSSHNITIANDTDHKYRRRLRVNPLATKIHRFLKEPIYFENRDGKYVFSVDISLCGTNNFNGFRYYIGDAFYIGFKGAVSGNSDNIGTITPFIGVNGEEEDSSISLLTGSEYGKREFVTYTVTVELNSDGEDTITLEAKDAENKLAATYEQNTVAVVTVTTNLTGSCEYIAFDSADSSKQARVDLYGFSIKGADYTEVNNIKASYNGITAENLVTEQFLTTQYVGSKYGSAYGAYLYKPNVVYAKQADGTTPVITGKGFTTNWMLLGSNGVLTELTDASGADMRSAIGESSSDYAIHSKTNEVLGRELLNDIIFDDSEVKYVFSVKNKSDYSSASNRVGFNVKIGNVFEAGYDVAESGAKAVPYLKINETKYTSQYSVATTGGGSASFNTIDISVYPCADGDDVISVIITDINGATASVTTTADLKGTCEYLAFNMNCQFIDDIFVNKYDKATLPQDDDPTEEVAPYPMEEIASETFADYTFGWGTYTKLANTATKTPTGTGWVGNWLEYNDNGELVALGTDKTIAQLYYVNGSSGDVAARYFQGSTALYRQLASPISFANVSGKYVFTVDVNTISGFTGFKYKINDSLTVGFNSTTAVPFIKIGDTTVSAINKIAVKENSSKTFSKFKVILDLNKDGEDTITVRVSTDGKNAGVTTTADLTGNCTHIGIDSGNCMFDNISIKGVDYSYYEIPESEIPYEYDIYPVALRAEETIAPSDYANAVNNKNIATAYTKVTADDGETQIDKVAGTGWDGNWLVKASGDTSYRAPADSDKVIYYKPSQTIGEIIMLSRTSAGTTLYRKLENPLNFNKTDGKYIFSADIKNGFSGSKSNVRIKIGDLFSAGYNAATNPNGTLVIEAGGRTVTSSEDIALGPVTSDASTNYYIHFDIEVYLKESGRDIIKLSATKKNQHNQSISGEEPVTLIAAADLDGIVEYIGFGSKPTTESQYRIDNIRVSGISGEEMEKLARIEVQNGEFKSKDGLKLLDTSKITDSVVYSFNLFNYFKEEKSADVFMGVFYDGKLAGIKKLTTTVAPKSVSESLTIGFADTLPEGSKENISVKVLVWEKDTFVPFTDRIDMYSKDDRAVTPEIFGKDAEGQTIVAFMGDSITHLNPSYTKWIEYYYRIKYPTKDIRFVSKGISGDSAGGNLGRFDWDIYSGVGTGTPTEACIMIGMNDVNKNLYPDGSDEDKQARIDSCLANIEAIADKCAEKGIKLTLITPTLYDEADYSGASSENNVGVNAGLGKIAERVIELANEKNLAYIDFYGYINSFNSALRKGEFAKSTIFNVSDRIHATPVGTFAEGFIFIDQQINDPIIASVDIDASTLTAKTDSAVVEGIAFTDGTLSYTYKPESLPMYTTEEYITCNNTYGIPVTDSINREIIKVSGLEEGSYKIMFGDADLGTYTAAQLAEGVNIATVANNPGQVQSKNVYDLVTSKMSKDYVLRNIAYVERSIYGKADLNNAQACIDYFNATSSLKNSTDSRFTVYVENKGKQAQVIEEIASLEVQAKVAAQPGTYNVQIIKQ